MRNLNRVISGVSRIFDCSVCTFMEIMQCIYLITSDLYLDVALQATSFVTRHRLTNQFYHA